MKKIIFSILLFFLTVLPAQASVLSLEGVATAASGDELRLDVYLDTEGKSVNALEGALLFDPQKLEYKDALSGGSAVSQWLILPRLADPGKIDFSGIIPGGVNDDHLLVFSAIFRSKAQGEAALDWNGASVYLNDGKATLDSLDAKPFKIMITTSTGAVPRDYDIKDLLPPEPFIPTVEKNENIFSGKWFLVFNAVDKQSGIDHYEISEGNGKFVSATSPYVLHNQRLNGKITVKAVDHRLNERIAVLEPAQLPEKTPFWLWPVLIIAALLAVSLVAIKLYNNIRNNSK